MVGPEVVAVVGSGRCEPSSEEYRLAHQVGRLLAEREVAIVCGGRRAGVMEAVARGAREARENALVIGLLPGANLTEAGEYLTIALPTGLGHARNALVVLAATRSVIAIGSGFGTLSEIGLAIKSGKRVITLLGPTLGNLLVATTAKEAVESALSA